MIIHALKKIYQKFKTNGEIIDNAQIDKDYIAKLQICCMGEVLVSESFLGGGEASRWLISTQMAIKWEISSHFRRPELRIFFVIFRKFVS